MKLCHAIFGSLAFVALVSTAPAKTYTLYDINNDQLHVQPNQEYPHVRKGISTVQAYFSKRKEIYAGLDPFKDVDSFGQHTDNLFNDFTVGSALVLLGWMGESPNGDWEKFQNFTRLRSMAGKLTPADLGKIPINAGICGIMGYILPYLSDSQVNSIDSQCVVYMIAIVVTVGKLPQLNNLPSELFTEKAEKIMEILGLDFKVPPLGVGIAELPDTQLGYLLSHEGACKQVNGVIMNALSRIDSKAKKMTAKCMKEALALNAEIYSLDGFSKDIFASYDKDLHDSYFAKMPKEMVAKFNSSLAASAQCKNMKPDKLTQHNIGSYTAECHKGYILNTTAPNIKLDWAKIADNIHSKFAATDNFDFLTRYDTASVKTMKKAHVEYLVGIPAACEKMPKEIFESHLGVKVPFECAVRIPKAETVVAILLGGTYDSDFLSKFTDSKVQAWSHDSGVRGLGVLNHVHNNVGQLIEKMGSSAEGTHPCASIKNFEDLKAATTLRAHMTADCMAAIAGRFTLTSEQYKELGGRVAEMQPFSEVLRAADEDFWKTLAPERAQNLFKVGLCNEIPIESFNLLQPAVLAVFPSECLMQYPHLAQVAPEKYSSFSDSILSKATAKQSTAIKIEQVADKQYANLSSAVPITEHFASTFTDKTYATMPPSKIKLTTNHHLQASPPAAFKGFTDKTWPELAPEALTDVDKERVENVPEDALAKTNAKQIEKLGKNVTDKSKDPLAAFTDKVQAKMSDDAKKALKVRSKGSDATRSTSATTALLAVTVLAAILIPAF